MSDPEPPGETGETPDTPPDWPSALAVLRSQADADGVLRDDPRDLFNQLADAGLDGGLP